MFRQQYRDIRKNVARAHATASCYLVTVTTLPNSSGTRRIWQPNNSPEIREKSLASVRENRRGDSNTVLETQDSVGFGGEDEDIALGVRRPLLRGKHDDRDDVRSLTRRFSNTHRENVHRQCIEKDGFRKITSLDHKKQELCGKMLAMVTLAYCRA